MITNASSNTPKNEGSQHSGNMNTNSIINCDSNLKPKLSSSILGGESLLQAAEQTRLLHGATQKVIERAYHMQRAMESDDVCAVLDNACLLLEELGDPNHGLHHKGPGGINRGGGGGGLGGGAPGGPPSFYSSAGGGVPPLGNYGDKTLSGHDSNNHGGGWVAPLTPKNYYELHMRVMDEMPSLEEYLLGLCHNINGLAQFYSPTVLYETVQYCPRVVPRLYLQICMGSVSIRSGSASAVRVMEELGEASKCVQCPVRGLFLRYYLLMALKDKLPDGSLDEEDGRKADETTMDEGEEIAPTPLLTHLDSALEILEVGSDVPTSPPPPLPPPPPPAMYGPLFPESELSGTPLFLDESLCEDPKIKTLASASFPSPKKSTTPATIAKDFNEAPSTKDPNEPRIGTFVDSYEFILRNFLEMNRLWIRIQHIPGDNSKETKRRRERERNDLRILVGSNLNRLSQLEGISAHAYGSKILPRILEEIASCRDPLAQAYLMDCIIQVFPDEYHLETLEVFLGVCPRLREKVNVRTILNNMMDRLLHYYHDEKLVNDEEDTNDVKATMAIHSFDMFEDCVHRYFEARGLNIPPKDVVRLQGCILNYALRIAPHNTDMISRCISQCARALGTLQEQKRASMMGQSLVLGGVSRKSMEIDMETVAITELEKLLCVPLNSMGLKVLDLPDFVVLLAFLPWENRRKVAISMVKSIIGAGGGDLEESCDPKKVRDVSMLEHLLTILAPLLRDEGMAIPVSTIYDSDNHVASAGGNIFSRAANLMGTLGISPLMMEDNDNFGGATGYSTHGGHSLGGDAAKLARISQEQSLIAKLVYTLYHEDTDVMYQMLNVVRRHIELGGAIRIVVALPPIVFSALGLLRRVRELEFPEPYIVHQAEGAIKDVEVVDELKDEASAVDKKAEKDDAKDGNEASDGSISANQANEESRESHDREEGIGDVRNSPYANKAKKRGGERNAQVETEPKLSAAEDGLKQLFPGFTKSAK